MGIIIEKPGPSVSPAIIETGTPSIINPRSILEPGGSGIDFGRCPVCNKPLRPHRLDNKEPAFPKPGKGFESRAKCTGCGTIIYYVGGTEWRVLLESDLDEMDRGLDKLRW